VASAILYKIPQRLNSIVTPKIKQWIGYDQIAYTELRDQPEPAQKWIFAMATVFPAVLAILSILPMFAYKIDKDTRDQMYAELNARRSVTAQRITDEEA
jgi:Na+/melibiose symporter-like transporter